MTPILIRGGMVLTMAEDGPEPTSGAEGAGFRPQALDILVEGGRIKEIGPALSPPQGAEIVEAAGRLVMPGLVNAHLHSSEMFYRGRYERMALESWLAHSYPFLGSTPLGLRALYLRSMLVAMESLRNGVTMISDDFFDPPRHDLERLGTVFAAYGDAGIRANIASGLMNLPYLDTIAHARAVFPPEVQAALDFPLTGTRAYMDYCDEVFRHLHGTGDGRLRFMLAPSGPQRCTVELMQACRDLSREKSVPYHTHVLETRTQAVTARQLFGGSILRFMADHELLHPGVLMAHAVWVTPEEIALMGEAGVSVSYNALANLKLGSGICPVRRLKEAGVTIALGTDGASSNDTMRLFDVIRAAALVQSANGSPPENWLGATEILQAATSGGAKAALLGDELGVLAAGRKADLVLLDLTRTTAFTPLSDAARQLVYCENGQSVESVMVDGRFVLRNGVFTTIDEAALLAEIRAILPALLADHERAERANDHLVLLFDEVIRRCNAEPLDLARHVPG